MTHNRQLKIGNQRGIGIVAAVLILLVLALLAAAMTTIGSTQQTTSAQDVMSARAWQAARAGNESGLFRALSTTTPADPWKTCGGGAGLSQTINLTAETGFRVTVTCNSWLYSEGESAPGVPQPVMVYRITAVACTAVAATATCPATDASVAGAGYMERRRVVIATN